MSRRCPIANVAHSSLTGSNLHEPKGIATAGSGEVYLANGAGSGTWTSLSGAQNPFANSLLHLTDSGPSGTTPQGLTGLVWNTRRYTTVNTNQIIGSSFGTNQFTLPAGTYWAEIQDAILGVLAGVSTVGGRIRLRNITDSTTTLEGPFVVNVSEIAYAMANLNLFGRFTIASPKVFELQLYAHVSGGSPALFGGGVMGIAGTAEKTNDIMIWKLT